MIKEKIKVLLMHIEMYIEYKEENTIKSNNILYLLLVITVMSKSPLN